MEGALAVRRCKQREHVHTPPALNKNWFYCGSLPTSIETDVNNDAIRRRP
jgi:hypothetical protein